RPGCGGATRNPGATRDATTAKPAGRTPPENENPALIHDLERVTVDVRKVWSKAQDTTKSATESITNRLDALAPACSPFAARWDAEADRRAKLRTPENLKALLDAQKAHNSARVTAATAKSQRTA